MPWSSGQTRPPTRFPCPAHPVCASFPDIGGPDGRPVRLLAVDPNPDNLAAFAERFALPLEDCFAEATALYAAVVPDAVSICTWPGLHVPMALAAIAAGVKAVVVEKPLALDVGEIRSLEHATAAHGTVVCVAHQRRYETPFQLLRDHLRSGVLGTTPAITARVGDGWDILSWTTHWFDMACFLFDGPPVSILAGAAVGSPPNRRYGHAVEDTSVVLAQWADGPTATFVSGPGSNFGVEIASSDGLARIQDNGVDSFTRRGFARLTGPAQDGFTRLMGEVVVALAGGPEPECSLRRCAIATEMAYAVHESARTQTVVTLPLNVHYAPLEVLARPTSGPAQGRRTALLADSHFNSGGRDGLAAALASTTGHPPQVISAETRGLVSADLEGIDDLVIYNTQEHADASTQKVLSRWVRAGKSLLVVHAGLGAWRHWPEFHRWCGLIWQWGVSTHPIEPMVLTTVPGDPLGLGFTGGWLPTDEAFIDLQAIAPVEVGLTITINRGSFPAAWRNAATPNVRCWMPGHRGDLWQVPVMRQGLGALLAGQVHPQVVHVAATAASA